MRSLPLPGNDFPLSETVVQRVDQLLYWTDFSVDAIPPSWDLELTVVKNGVRQTDHEAQRVLAFLLTWCSSRYGRPRFSGSALNVSYTLLMMRFGIATENRVVDLLKRMEHDHGVIYRFSRGLGKGKGAVLYLAPNMERVEGITYPVTMNPVTGELRRQRAGDPVSGGPYSVPTLRQHEASSAGLACWEDERAVHVVSLLKRSEGSPGVPSWPAYPTTYDEPVCPAQPDRAIDASGLDGQTGPVDIDANDDRTTGRLPAGPTEQISLSPRRTSERNTAAAPLIGAEPAALLRPSVRGRAQTNAPAQSTTCDADIRLSHQIGLFRWRFEREMERTANVTTRRAVVRTAWQAATRLLPAELSSDDVYNAWQRLERAGSVDPALDLLSVAVLACGRCMGALDERKDVASALLDAVGRNGATSAIDPAQPQDVAAVDRALRTALQHRLDRYSLRRLVVHVCHLDQQDSRTHAFVNGLVRLYETHEVPFNAALFAGALAAVVRDHRNPTAVDLLDACESESRLYPLSRVRAGDTVLLGRWSLWTEGMVAHVSVLTLGKVPPRTYGRAADEVWSEVEEIHVDDGRAVAVTRCGSVVLLERAQIERHGNERLFSLAEVLDTRKSQALSTAR